MDADKMKETAAKLIDEVVDAKSAASESLGAAGDKLTLARERAVEALESFADRANCWARKGWDKASDVQHRARREIEKASDATAAYVEQQPLKSVVIAAGIGAAAAALIMLLNDRRR